MRAYERFLRYVGIYTASDPQSGTVPSSAEQFDLARFLVEEMKGLGIADARVDEKCYVYGSIPATPGCEKTPRLGFIAHMDTSPDFCGAQVQPRLIENYEGGDVLLCPGRTLRAADFPHLTSFKGRTLITANGATLLGADDKAGIAEILTAAERLLQEDIAHGHISIGFTPDEEIGAGADHFSLEAFGADYAYTVDGGPEGEIVYENFNAGSADFTIQGFNIHPGEAKDRMVNAALVAMEVNAMLPPDETPRDTENYEGFYHLCDMEGSVETAKLHYILRDHNAARFATREAVMRDIEQCINEKYGPGTATLTLKEQYRNMDEMIRPHFHLIETAKAAIRDAGIEPIVKPIRGGTDGARLSFMGLPCPNLGTGGYAFHGPFEHISIEGMDAATEIILGIIKRYTV